MAHVLGKNFRIQDPTTSDRIIASAKECSVDVKTEMQEVSSPDQGVAKEFIPHRYSWTVSVSGLVGAGTSLDALFGFGTRRTKLPVAFADTQSRCWKGNAYITSVKASGRVGQIMTYQLSMQGTGALTIQDSPGQQTGGRV